MAVYPVCVTLKEQSAGQSATVPQVNVFVSQHAMERTAVAADLVSSKEGMKK